MGGELDRLARVGDLHGGGRDGAVGVLGHEGHVDGEEVVRVAVYAELQGPRLVGGVDEGQAPLQDLLVGVEVVLSVTLVDHWGSHTWGRGEGGRNNQSIQCIAHIGQTGR